MDKKIMADVLTKAGFIVFSNQIKTINVLSERKNVNSAGVTVKDYSVSTTVGKFVVSESLKPNKFGATAFSTEIEYTVKQTQAYKEDIEDESAKSEDL